MIVSNDHSVFAQPDDRQHRLRKCPPQNSIGVQLQSIGKAFNSSLDCSWLQEHFRVLNWISKGRANLILRFAQHTFGVDGQPSSLRIEQDVTVMEVAMQ